MKKKLIALLLTLVMAVCLLTACSSGSSGGNKVIGVVAKGESHAFWQAVKSGATDAAAKYGYTISI